MNWPQLITDLREVMTLQEIATAIGLGSRGTVHNIQTGYQKGVTYEVGQRLVDLHRKKAKAIAAAKEARNV